MAARVALPKLVALLAAGLLAASCVVSPQPTPPDTTLDGNLIGLNPGVELAQNVVGFHAAPGAVNPPEGVVIVTNLDAADAPSIAAVESDGSFNIAVPGQPGQSFRFQAKNQGARSNPFDVIVGPSGGDLGVFTTTLACVTVEPGLWLSLPSRDAQRDLVVRNKCSEPVTFAAPHLRRNLAGFSFTPASAFDLAAGATRTFTVSAGDGAEAEDVLEIDLTAPVAGRRAVTLTVPDP